MIHLGLSLTPFGHDPQAWRDASVGALGFDALLKQVLLAKEADFDFVWLGDRMGERPVDMLSPLAIPSLASPSSAELQRTHMPLSLALARRKARVSFPLPSMLLFSRSRTSCGWVRPK